jgi:uncharacterized short protein YbdD (DUF466 family)
MLGKLKIFWAAIRQLSGDDAYERYLLHQLSQHPDKTPLSKAEFFKQWQNEKWSGIKRCC